MRTRLSQTLASSFCLWALSNVVLAVPSCPAGVAPSNWSNCLGEVTLEGGRLYRGPFVSGKPSGNGEVVFPNGYRYRGDVEAGRFHGLGVLLSSDGRVLQSGEWSSGSFLRSTNSPTLDALASTASPPDVLSNRSDVTSMGRPLTSVQAQRPSKQQAETPRSQVSMPPPETKGTVSMGKQTTIPEAKPAPVTGVRRALVVGNDSYKSVPALVNARADAEAVANSLKALGYQVVIKVDLDEKSFKRNLREFKESIRGGDEVLFFFAGHGVQIGSANYLLPVDIQSDSEEQVRDESIALQRVLDDFSEQKARFSLAMIDACRDNPFKSSTRRIGARGLATTQAANGQMIIFSAGSGQQALDKLGPNDTERNGLFTRVFLKEIAKPGVPIDRVMKNVRAQVHDMARSIGHDQVPAIYDQVVGDFYFAR